MNYAHKKVTQPKCWSKIILNAKVILSPRRQEQFDGGLWIRNAKIIYIYIYIYIFSKSISPTSKEHIALSFTYKQGAHCSILEKSSGQSSKSIGPLGHMIQNIFHGLQVVIVSILEVIHTIRENNQVAHELA